MIDVKVKAEHNNRYGTSSLKKVGTSYSLPEVEARQLAAQGLVEPIAGKAKSARKGAAPKKKAAKPVTKAAAKPAEPSPPTE